MSDPNCDSCRFFGNNNAVDGAQRYSTASCVRHAPVRVWQLSTSSVQNYDGNGEHSVWPQVRPNWWCGDYEPYVQPQPKQAFDGPSF